MAVKSVHTSRVKNRKAADQLPKLPQIQTPPQKSSLGTKNIRKAVNLTVRKRLKLSE